MSSATDVTGRQVCILCHQEGHAWLHVDSRTMLRCAGCGLLWVLEGVAHAEDGKTIYESDTPIFVQQGNEAYYLDETNTWSSQQKLNWISRFVPRGARLLDVGANFGHFLAAAENDYEIAGLEVSPMAAFWAKENFGVSIDVGSVNELDSTSEKFDAITCWDVIEHLTDPLDAIDRMRETLTKDGHLFLSTPDAASFVAAALGRRWHYLDLIQHTVLFGHNNLSQILGDHGFRVVARRSFGHYYRIQYVIDRLNNLHGKSLSRLPSWLFCRTLQPFRDRSIYIGLGDVMGIAAQRCYAAWGG